MMVTIKGILSCWILWLLSGSQLLAAPVVNSVYWTQKKPIQEEWYSPTPNRRYHIGVMLPHQEDSYWQAVRYGILSHAKTLGVEVTLEDMGGYIHFGKQRSLLSHLNQNTDGIILASVSYDRMNHLLGNLSVPVIGLINDIDSSVIRAKARVSYYDAGYQLGKYLVTSAGGKDIRFAFLAGPEHSRWSKDMSDGLLDAIAHHKSPQQRITPVVTTYGDTRSEVQRLRLAYVLEQVKEAGLDYIVGNAVAAVEAVSVVPQSSGIKIFSTYMTPDVYEQIKQGRIQAAPYDQTLLLSRIALDMMVRQLNGERAGYDFPYQSGGLYQLISQDNISRYPYENLFGSERLK